MSFRHLCCMYILTILWSPYLNCRTLREKCIASSRCILNAAAHAHSLPGIHTSTNGAVEERISDVPFVRCLLYVWVQLNERQRDGEVEPASGLFPIAFLCASFVDIASRVTVRKWVKLIFHCAFMRAGAIAKFGACDVDAMSPEQ